MVYCILYGHKGTIELKIHCQILSPKENFNSYIKHECIIRLNIYKRHFVSIDR